MIIQKHFYSWLRIDKIVVNSSSVAFNSKGTMLSYQRPFSNIITKQDVFKTRAFGPIGENIILRNKYFSETYNIIALISLYLSKYLYVTGIIVTHCNFL